MPTQMPPPNPVRDWPSLGPDWRLKLAAKLRRDAASQDNPLPPPMQAEALRHAANLEAIHRHLAAKANAD